MNNYNYGGLNQDTFFYDKIFTRENIMRLYDNKSDIKKFKEILSINIQDN